MKYHTLVGLNENGKWEIVFGDYVKKVVQEEKAEVRGQYAKTKIITTNDAQNDIELELDLLNLEF